MRPRALLLDVGGTLLDPAEPVALTYARAAARHGLALAPEDIAPRFKAALRGAPGGQLGDGRPFWRHVVAATLPEAAALGPEGFTRLFEELYLGYEDPAAWRVAPGAHEALDALRAGGIALAVASNWDTRLRPLLRALDLDARFDHLAISGELGVEKPAAGLFRSACAALGVAPGEALHVGDSAEADVQGARAAGLAAWWWGVEVRTFDELARRLLPEK